MHPLIFDWDPERGECVLCWWHKGVEGCHFKLDHTTRWDAGSMTEPQTQVWSWFQSWSDRRSVMPHWYRLEHSRVGTFNFIASLSNNTITGLRPNSRVGRCSFKVISGHSFSTLINALIWKILGMDSCAIAYLFWYAMWLYQKFEADTYHLGI